MNVATKTMYRTLIVEDQHFMLVMLSNELQKALSRAGQCVVEGAETIAQARQLLRGSAFDLVVIDPTLPGFDPTSRTDRLVVVEEIIRASPDAIHIVCTGFDRANEADSCKDLGAAAYVSKTGLDAVALGEILQEISETDFSLRLCEVTSHPPHFRYSELQPIEQEILDCMRNRPNSMKRKDIFEMLADRDGVHADAVEKRYRRARAKVLKNGLALPKGL